MIAGSVIFLKGKLKLKIKVHRSRFSTNQFLASAAIRSYEANVC